MKTEGKNKERHGDKGQPQPQQWPGQQSNPGQSWPGKQGGQPAKPANPWPSQPSQPGQGR